MSVGSAARMTGWRAAARRDAGARSDRMRTPTRMRTGCAQQDALSPSTGCAQLAVHKDAHSWLTSDRPLTYPAGGAPPARPGRGGQPTRRPTSPPPPGPSRAAPAPAVTPDAARRAECGPDDASPAVASGLPALRIDHVTKTFVVGRHKRPVVAVADVPLRVERGGILGILGANGGGKSTLIRLISTLLTLDAGRIEIFGLDVERDEMAVKRLINRVSADAAFFKKLSPAENLVYAARLYGIAPSVARGGAGRPRPSGKPGSPRGWACHRRSRASS